MTEKKERSPRISLKEGESPFEVDVVELFKDVVGGETQNVATVASLLKAQAEALGSDFSPRAHHALKVIEAATYFYDIDWNTKDRGGYNFVKEFSGPPVIFQNPYSLAKEFVDPQDADQFQTNNPDWKRLTEEDIERYSAI